MHDVPHAEQKFNMAKCDLNEVNDFEDVNGVACAVLCLSISFMGCQRVK